MDFILNGQATGSVAATLLQNGMDVSILRPFIGEDGKSYITANGADGKPTALTTNAPATLRFEDWRVFDTAVVKAAKQRLRLVADLRSSGLSYNVPGGMGKTVLTTETQTDISGATISMDGTRKGNNDRPEYSMTNLPLPIIHKDFSFSARQIQVARQGGSPLDTTMAELAARKVAEEAEKLHLGVNAAFTFGGGSIYGLTNFPQRITATLVNPNATGWTPKKTYLDVALMKKASQDKFHYGPWVLYNSPAWDVQLDADYSDAKGDITLRERLKKIDGIQDIRTLDFLTGYQMLLVQQTTDVVRSVIGMDITTVQWESQGGMEVNFKVMAIMVPQIRADANGNTGIVHGVAP